MPITKLDIIGQCSGRLYAKAGTRVREVADYGNVIIAEDGEGKRFPVRKELLTDDPAQVSEMPVVTQTPAPVIQRKQKKKAPPVDKQQNLF